LDCVGSFAIDLATKQGRNKRMYKIIGADQKEYGPVSADEMRRWMAEGRVNAQTLIQGEGQTDWRPLSTFPEFSAAAQGTPLATAPVGDAARLVSGPATALLVVGILGALTAAISVGVISFSARLQNLLNMPPQWQELFEKSTTAGGLVRNIVGLAVSAFIIFASTKMRKLESRGLVMTATIFSMLPCLSPCCCIGIPLGIWILIVLNKPEVKSAFH
jgi:hypothetical protein